MKSNGVYTVGVPEPSPPSRRRGLKFKLANVEEKKIEVASFAEAWIEIIRLTTVLTRLKVASFAEAWIEIKRLTDTHQQLESPPSRRRGLKSYLNHLRQIYR